jgi:hypothetical protein
LTFAFAAGVYAAGRAAGLYAGGAAINVIICS